MIRNERATRTIGTMSLCAALLAASGAEALTVSTVSRVTGRPTSTAEQVSGITFAGGNLFYAVDDTDKKLYPITLNIGSDGSLTPSGISIGTGVLMSGAADAEGCAFDPCSGNLWVSDETGATIREYDVTSGALLRTAPVPAIQKQYYGNYSLEALTISGDGRTMWTANEEALKVDGLLATNSVGSVVRLTKFVRDSVHDNWTADGQWAYETQPIGTLKDQYTRSGVSGLCALPDGTLLVLERRCYDGGFYPDFEIRIYQVNFSGATDIRNISSLKTATYTKTTKTSLWSYSHGNNMPNYEGICLGPRLGDGSCSLVLISDAGSYAEAGVFTLKLSGLSNIRTMYFTENQNSEPYGGPYRYVNGASVTATLPGAGNLYYEAKKVVHACWRLLNDASNQGEGSTATFKVTSDDTLVWDSTTDSSLPILDADSFEHVALGTTANPSDLPGWSGGEDGYVAAKSYSPALPPGYPLNRETHTQVLEVDGNVTRTYDTSIVGGVILDTMIRATLPTPDTPVADNTDCFIAFHFDEQGHPMLQHAHRGQTARLAAGRAARRAAASGEGDGSIPNIRTVLSENTYTNGQWLRLTMKIDRSSGSTWCHVSIDGFACVTTNGAYQAGNPQMDGAWYRTISTNEVISAIELKGTGAVDDVTLFTATANDPNSEFPEFKVTDENDNRLPDADFYEWLNENGLPLDPNADVDGDTFPSLKEYQKGTDPWNKGDHPPFPTVLIW